MSKLIKDASVVKIYGYSFRSRTRGSKQLPDRGNENAVFTTIPQAQDIVAKRHLVQEANPLFYALGEKLIPRNGMDYADWVEKLEVK